jgi:hypothetical protein
LTGLVTTACAAVALTVLVATASEHIKNTNMALLYNCTATFFCLKLYNVFYFEQQRAKDKFLPQMQVSQAL